MHIVVRAEKEKRMAQSGKEAALMVGDLLNQFPEGVVVNEQYLVKKTGSGRWRVTHRRKGQ